MGVGFDLDVLAFSRKKPYNKNKKCQDPHEKIPGNLGSWFAPSSFRVT
jgi:hypothetical protein